MNEKYFLFVNRRALKSLNITYTRADVQKKKTKCSKN